MKIEIKKDLLNRIKEVKEGDLTTLVNSLLEKAIKEAEQKKARDHDTSDLHLWWKLCEALEKEPRRKKDFLPKNKKTYEIGWRNFPSEYRLLEYYKYPRRKFLQIVESDKFNVWRVKPNWRERLISLGYKGDK